MERFIKRKAYSFEHFSFWKTALILFLFQFLSSRLIESYALNHPEILSGEIANILINYVMHGGVLSVALLILKYYGLSIQKITGSFSLKESHFGRWTGYEILILLITVTFLLTLANVILRFISAEDLLPFGLFQEEVLDTPFFIFPIYLLTFTLAPVMEEVVFRGILLNKWGEKMSWKWAILLSSFLFAFLHFKLFLPQFLLGILYSIIYLKTGRLTVSILWHALHNFLLGLLMLIPTAEETSNMEISIAPSLLEIPPEVFWTLNVGTVLFLILLFILFLLFRREIRGLPLETPYKRNGSE